MTEQRLDPQMSPRDIRGYKKQKKQSRKQFLQMNNLEFKTSEYPKHYKKGEDSPTNVINLNTNNEKPREMPLNLFSPSRVIRKVEGTKVKSLVCTRENQKRQVVKID